MAKKKADKREDVIGHLQIMHTWAAFALEHDLDFFEEAHLRKIMEWTEEALELVNGMESGRGRDGEE